MKKILAAMIMTTIVTTSHAEVNTAVPAPTEQESFTVKWHPTSVAIGAVVGGALVGGVGAVVIGGLVGEVVIRVIKKKQEKTAETQK